VGIVEHQHALLENVALPINGMLDLHRQQVRRTILNDAKNLRVRTGLTNRLQALLKQYFPQALQFCGEAQGFATFLDRDPIDRMERDPLIGFEEGDQMDGVLFQATVFRLRFHGLVPV
jgi:hypothetical protein